MHRCLGCMELFADTLNVCPHCGYALGTQAKSKNHMEPGTVLRERYTIGKVLGQGGFGVTYIAWDPVLDIPVAIKEYMPTALAYRLQGEQTITCPSQDAQVQFNIGLRRIASECKTISKFRDLESVVHVYDFFEENGTAYIVMELLRGLTVRQILQEYGKIPYALTIEIITPILQTLQAMHEKQIIHRDVAPDNLFVCDNGKIKLLDFGAARAASLGADGKTLSVILKEGYAPREQYSTRGEQGAFTDVYAVCATMYHMLTGEKPVSCLDRTGNDASDFPALFVLKIPQAVRSVLLRGLQMEPQARYASAADLQQALQNAAADSPTRGTHFDLSQLNTTAPADTVVPPVPISRSGETSAARYTATDENVTYPVRRTQPLSDYPTENVTSYRPSNQPPTTPQPPVEDNRGAAGARPPFLRTKKGKQVILFGLLSLLLIQGVIGLMVFIHRSDSDQDSQTTASAVQAGKQASVYSFDTQGGNNVMPATTVPTTTSSSWTTAPTSARITAPTTTVPIQTRGNTTRYTGTIRHMDDPVVTYSGTPIAEDSAGVILYCPPGFTKISDDTPIILQSGSGNEMLWSGCVSGTGYYSDEDISRIQSEYENGVNGLVLQKLMDFSQSSGIHKPSDVWIITVGKQEWYFIDYEDDNGYYCSTAMSLFGHYMNQLTTKTDDTYYRAHRLMWYYVDTRT